MRHAHLIFSAALVATAFLTGCKSDNTSTAMAGGTTTTSRSSDLMLPSGTIIDVALGTELSSKTAGVGSSWSGTVRNALVVDGRTVVPAGSSIAGTVTSVTPAHKGDRAMLDLGLTSMTVGAHSYQVHGGMESVVAGSTRARNLGAIGAAAVVGAIVGHQVGHSGKGTVIGGLVGAGAATAVVAGTDGYQVELKAGTPLTFTTSQSVAVRS